MALIGGSIMKKYVAGLVFSMILPVTQSYAGNVNFNVGVNLGVPAPVYAAPAVVVSSPPEFVAPPELGFFVAVGVPYDIFFYGNGYWLCRNGAWFSARYYNGPWGSVAFAGVPRELRRYPLHSIHRYRDAYYTRYRGYASRDYRHFQPGRHEIARQGRDEGRGWGHDSRHNDRGNGYDRGEGHGERGR